MIESCWLLFAYLTPIFGALPPDGAVRRVIADPLPAHYEGPPYMPWMPGEGSVVAEGCDRPSHVLRDGYRSIQVNVDRYACNIPADAANEPSIAIDPTDPRKIVIGWRQFDTIESDFRQAGYAYSHDAGHTWVFPGSLTPGVFGTDPVLDADAEGTIYYLSINFDEMRLFKSFNGAVTWNPAIRVVSGLADKPWMAIDRTQSVGRGNIYIYWTSGTLLRSTDGGTHFSIPFRAGSGGYATVAVGPEGELFIAEGIGALVQVNISFNAFSNPEVVHFDAVFLTLGSYPSIPVPNPGGLLGQTWVTVHESDGPDAGNVYLLTLATLDPVGRDPSDIAFTRSRDRGTNWSRPIVINDDPPHAGAWQWFAMMSVAPNGRVDAVWNDTRNYLDAPAANLSELYYSYSTDAGDNWSPNVPVSPVFNSRIGWPYAQDKLGDYYHMLSDNLGVNVAYAATFNGEQDVYFLRIGPWDCNGNEIPDENDIAAETSLDCNANEVPDECEYRGDSDGDRLTTLRDLAAFQNCFTGATASPLSKGGSRGVSETAPRMNRNATIAPGINPDATSRIRPTKPITARTETLPSPCCGLFDLEPDGDVDSTDLAAIQRTLSGP